MAAQAGRQEAAALATGDVGERPVAGNFAASKPAFIGREHELGTLAAVLSDPPALVLVEGEAGIGKTRLLREVLAAPSLSDRMVLVAACPPLLEPFPLGAVVGGVRRLRPDVTQLGLSPLGGALRPLFPEWVDQLPPALEALDDPTEVRQRLFGALTELVEQLGVDVLVVEDAHWADSATLEWLLTLAAAGGGMSVVVTFRPWDMPEGSLLPRLTSRPAAALPLVRVELRPLTTGHTQQLVESMFAAGHVSEQFAVFLHDRTGGIPLALEEYLLLLRDRDDIVFEDGAWARRVLDELEVPATVRDSVLERVARLRPEARWVLQAAAVLSAPADAGTLTVVAELDSTAGRQGLAAALVSGLLQESDPGRFVFRHAVDAEAVGDAIPVSELRHLHSQAAEVLVRWEPQPVARLERHYREAGETEQWCHYAEAAADAALESGDDHAAVVRLLTLLTTVDHTPVRCGRLARKLGEAAVWGAAPLAELAPQVSEVLRTVVADADVPARGEVRFLLGRLLMQRGELDAAFGEFEAAVPELDRHPALAARAMLYLALPVTRGWPVTKHVGWLERAGTLLPQIDAGPERLSFTIWHATGLLVLGEESGWQAAEKIPRWASTERERREIAIGLVNVAQCATLWGRYGDARLRLATLQDYLRTTGYERGMDVVRIANAHLDWYTGGWGKLTGLGELAGSGEVQPTTRLEARLIQGWLALAWGARGLAEQHLGAVQSGLAQGGQVEPLVFPSPALARLRLVDGDAEKALQLTEHDVEMIVRKGVWVWATEVAPAHVEALVGAGRVSEAEDLVRQFAEGLDGRDAPAPAAALATCHAILAQARGRLGEASALFAQAATAWAGLPRPYDELLALERQGGCLLTVGGPDRALALLTEVEQRLYQLGARWDADRVARELRQHGVSVARAWRRGPKGYGDQLSPRELEAVRLVARGMTNRQTAETLFLSPRTVDRHLSSAMRKLGASSRAELTLAAAEASLIPPKIG